jgi:hypothetical protein
VVKADQHLVCSRDLDQKIDQRIIGYLGNWWKSSSSVSDGCMRGNQVTRTISGERSKYGFIKVEIDGRGYDLSFCHKASLDAANRRREVPLRFGDVDYRFSRHSR